MLINVLFFLLINVRNSLTTTSIKTYPTVNLTENVRFHTNVIQLIEDEDVRKVKLILLNLGGYETNLFEIKSGSIYTINEIDREQFVGEKRCFDRLYCLIEIHILVNDGEEYWVIPIHIIDENDNKPQFKNASIDLKFYENNLNGYKIPFEGAIDLDEGENSKISYILDCSIKKKEIKENIRLINCYPLFDLIIFSSSSLINQYDQLGLKFNPSSSSSLSYLNKYSFILYGFNLNKKDLMSSMIINIQIEKVLEKPKFILSEYKFIIKEKSLLKKGERIGEIKAKSNDLTKKLIYRIINETTKNRLIEINSLTGELFVLNDQNIENVNEINLFIESFYFHNQNLKSFIYSQILIRLSNQINKYLINYQIKSKLIQQLNNSNQFFISKQNLFSSNDILFHLSILSFYYPTDLYILSILNSDSIFSLVPSSLEKNNYFLQINNSNELNSLYYLIIQIKHQLTNQYLSNLTIQFIVNNSSIICLENSIYHLYHLNKTNSIGKVKVVQTNSNLSSFSTFTLSEMNLNVNECQMLIIDFDYLNLTQSQYQLCSPLSNQCFHISSNDIPPLMKTFLLERLLTIRPIEITILILSLIFIFATITLILIICRLKGFRLCLTIKNYIFYGKKYGLHNAQRLSSNKITKRVESIVVRESRSPSIEHIKSIEPYIFNINQFMEQETNPSINLYSESSLHQSTSSTLQREQRTIPQSSSTVVQETKQLLDMISSNQELDLPRLASEV